jgi:hypothetical protein
MPLTLVNGRVRYDCKEHGALLPGWRKEARRGGSAIAYCRPCKAASAALYTKPNAHRLYYKAHAEEERARGRANYWKDPERHRARARAYAKRKRLADSMPEPAKNKSVLALNI